MSAFSKDQTKQIIFAQLPSQQKESKRSKSMKSGAKGKMNKSDSKQKISSQGVIESKEKSIVDDHYVNTLKSALSETIDENNMVFF